jgi:rod shape-determining protein MreD
VSIAVVWFLSDLLLMRPPGLMTALVILGAEYLIKRGAGLRDASFLGEWTAVALTIIGITVLYRTTLWLFAVDQAQLSLSVIQAALTIAAYPVIAGFTHYVLGVRKLAPGDSDAIGGRA